MRSHYEKRQIQVDNQLQHSQNALKKAQVTIKRIEEKITSLTEEPTRLVGLIKDDSNLEIECGKLQAEAKKLDAQADPIITSVEWMLMDLRTIQENGHRLLQDDDNRQGLADAVFKFLDHTDKNSVFKHDSRLQTIGTRMIDVVSKSERSSHWTELLRRLTG